jgi:hypothetical protein
MAAKDYVIVEHQMPQRPDGAFGRLARSPLNPSNANDLDWDYNNQTNVFFYISKPFFFDHQCQIFRFFHFEDRRFRKERRKKQWLCHLTYVQTAIIAIVQQQR